MFQQALVDVMGLWATEFGVFSIGRINLLTSSWKHAVSEVREVICPDYSNQSSENDSFWLKSKKFRAKLWKCPKDKKNSLDDFVLNYLKEKGFVKSFKSLRDNHGSGESLVSSDMLQKLQTFLRSEKSLTSKTEPDDLGFEINFDIFQPEAKYPAKTNVNSVNSKIRAEPVKRPRKKADKKIPKGSFQ